MGLLFLDPFVLVVIAVMLIGCWLVWRGALRSWFGRPGAWTVLVWPLPVVLVALPFLVGPLRAALPVALDLAGWQLNDTAAAFVFAVLYLVPLVALTLWPPRWLLPPWARARLVPPARALAAGPSAAARAPEADVTDRSDIEHGSGTIVLPACLGHRGHGSRARWIWQVDAVSGTLAVTDGRVRFRPDPPAETSFPISDLSTSSDPTRRAERSTTSLTEAHTDSSGPRPGASWGRRYLDADLAAVDRVRIHARRPWAEDGVLTLEVAGRPSAHLWVGDVTRLRAALGSTRG